ncbi:MAG: BON domain-containing protein [Planctomycetota bacterium]|nr:BON domain-containing protein [Planctomycetota bacterium]
MLLFSSLRSALKSDAPRLVATGRVLGLAVLLAVFAAPVAAQTEEITDDRIENAVTTELGQDDGVPAHLVDIVSKDGVVELSGSVDTLLAKERAVKIAQSVKGVRAVVNRIEVNVIERPDEKIRSDVRQAFLLDPAADSYEVDVRVADGVVTLEGTVESWAERSLCRTIAKSVRGVRDVVNNIEVTYTEGRLDPEIRREIVRRLQNDVWVDAPRLNVEVDDGEVALEGAVGSAFERSRAIMKAWVAGVRDVDASEVQIRWWINEPMQAAAAPGRVRTDEAIRRAVEDAFMYDPRVLSFKPEVMVDDGVVTLTGEVGDYAAKRAAGADARNTTGVLRVHNLLRVRPPEPVPADELATDVRRALGRDPYVERFDVAVVVRNGKVDLYGDVDTRFERRRAADVASRVKGVIDVVNHIDVGDEWTYVDDVQIVADINDELWWSPFVDSDEVTVTVSNGVATLSGVVDSWSERAAAAKNAFDGGARAVVNELEVQPQEATTKARSAPSPSP